MCRRSRLHRAEAASTSIPVENGTDKGLRLPPQTLYYQALTRREYLRHLELGPKYIALGGGSGKLSAEGLLGTGSWNLTRSR